MGFFGDFKKFAFKGNVVDLAVGVVLATGFSKIVNAIVEDFIMPVVALMMPSGNWREAGWVLRRGPTPKEDVVLKWAHFLGATLDFLIVAFVLFLVVSRIVKAMEKRFFGDEPVVTRECPFCLETIPVKATRCKACTSQVDPVAS